jgi:hypothetical protein
VVDFFARCFGDAAPEGCRSKRSAGAGALPATAARAQATLGAAPTIDLVAGRHKANTSAIVGLFLSRIGETLDRPVKLGRSAKK